MFVHEEHCEIVSICGFKGVLNTVSHVVVLKLQKMNASPTILTKCAEWGQMRYDNKYKL